VPRFGKDKDARKEELDRMAAEEVERLTRRGGPPGMGGGVPGMGPTEIMSSPLDRIAAELADAPRPSERLRQQGGPRRAAAPKPQQAFTPLPSGEVGSSFGPGGLNPGPRGGGGAPPPPAFAGGGDDYGGHVTGPPVYFAGEPDEEEEMSITELALMDHAAHTGHSPEDLVMQYDATSAEEMRDEAMRKFYERQQARRPGAGTNNPFAPAGMRGPSGPVNVRRKDDPAAAGGALAQRLANRRRREEEEARRARGGAETAASPSAAPSAREADLDEGALARVLARRRQSLGMDEPATADPAPTPGRRHATSRAEASSALRAVPTPADDESYSEEDEAPPAPAPRSARAAKKAAAPVAKRSPAAKAAAAGTPAAKAPAAKSKKAGAGATLAKPVAKAPATKKKAAPAGKAKTIFCIECGEKNPAVAKFCFNCGNRLQVT